MGASGAQHRPQGSATTRARMSQATARWLRTDLPGLAGPPPAVCHARRGATSHAARGLTASGGSEDARRAWPGALRGASSARSRPLGFILLRPPASRTGCGTGRGLRRRPPPQCCAPECRRRRRRSVDPQRACAGTTPGELTPAFPGLCIPGRRCGRRRRTRRAPRRAHALGPRMPSVSAWRSPWVSPSARHCVAALTALTSSWRPRLSVSFTRNSSALRAAASATALPSHKRCGTPRSAASSAVRCAGTQRTSGICVGISAHRSASSGCARTLVAPRQVDVNHLRRWVRPRGPHQCGEFGFARLLLPGATGSDPSPYLAFWPDHRPSPPREERVSRVHHTAIRSHHMGDGGRRRPYRVGSRLIPGALSARRQRHVPAMPKHRLVTPGHTVLVPQRCESQDVCVHVSGGARHRGHMSVPAHSVATVCVTHEPASISTQYCVAVCRAHSLDRLFGHPSVRRRQLSEVQATGIERTPLLCQKARMH